MYISSVLYDKLETLSKYGMTEQLAMHMLGNATYIPLSKPVEAVRVTIAHINRGMWDWFDYCNRKLVGGYGAIYHWRNDVLTIDFCMQKDTYYAPQRAR